MCIFLRLLLHKTKKTPTNYGECFCLQSDICTVAGYIAGAVGKL